RIFTATALALAVLAGCQGEEPQVQTAADPAPVAEAPAAETTASVPAANITDERLLNAADEPSQWMMVGGTYEERHYSPLSEINGNNLDQLGLAWYADYDTNLSQQGTPLYIDGVIYVSTAWSKVY